MLTFNTLINLALLFPSVLLQKPNCPLGHRGNGAVVRIKETDKIVRTPKMIENGLTVDIQCLDQYFSVLNGSQSSICRNGELVPKLANCVRDQNVTKILSLFFIGTKFCH